MRPPIRHTALLLPLLFLCSCTYLGNRGRDLVDPFRVSVGAGTAVGVRGSALGLVDSGLMVGVKPNASSLGLRYGRLRYLGKDATFDADQAEIIRYTSIVEFDYGNGSYDSASTGSAVLPFLFTWSDSPPRDYEWTVPEEGETFRELNWIWSAETTRNNRYAQIHAFDIEVDLGLVVYGEWGFSPGEVVDFFLGILTIDIAMDDDRTGGGR
jgi:hypothetical protein